MPAGTTEANRCVQLTEAGLKRLHEARRKYRKTIENIVQDDNTPSVNTVKKAFRQGLVFVDTLERIWDYLRACAEARHEVLPDLVRGEDYIFVGGSAGATPQTERGEANDAQTKAAQDKPPSLPRGWLSRSVPRSNRLFMGRRDVLDRLHAALTTNAITALTDAQALTGMGGIGKTQTALAYLYAHRNAYNGIFWIYAETPQSLDDGLASLAEELNLPASSSATKQDAAQKMRAWFQANAGWLLVLDNADDLRLLAPHFPRHHNGSLLLTTRAKNTVHWASGLEIHKLARKEGALLLLRYAGVLSPAQSLLDALAPTRQAALELSGELDGLPLALSQAGAYLAETGLSLTEYLAKYRRQGIELLDQSPDQRHAPVAITFRLALEQIARNRFTGLAAANVVRLCAFLAPDAIPETILTSFCSPRSAPPASAQKTLPDETSAQEREDYAEVRAAVCRYSLLSRDAQANTLSIHRLVQKVIQDALEAEAVREWKERAVCAVSQATPDFEFDDWPLCDLLLPHWRLCAQYIQEHTIETPQAAYLMYQAGRYLRARAVYGEAETLLRRAVTITETLRAGKENADYSDAADYMDALACLYRELGRYEEARPLHERALQLCEDAVGAAHPDTAGKLHNLALLYMEQKEFARAEACLLRVVEIHQCKTEQEPMYLAAALTQLAGAYRYQGCYAKAEPYSRKALQIYEEKLGPSHIEVASACNNLALLCINLKRYAEAESLSLRALHLNEAHRGREHPETGTAHWTLATTLWEQKRMAEAGEASFRRAMRIYEQHFASSHPRFARLLSFYADFQKACEL